MGKIIGVWGSPNSGKTTLSIKLGKELSKKNSVIVLFPDMIAPIIPTLKENIDTNKSLGNVLSSVTITDDIVLKNCIEMEGFKNIAFLGYSQYENVFSYPQYDVEKVKELFETLKELVDYVIVDTTSNFVVDLLTTITLELGDKILRLNSSELKNISYYDSYLPLLLDSKYNIDNHINILNNVKDDDPIEELIDILNVKSIIKYSEEIRDQSLCSNLMQPLSCKEEVKLTNSLKDILELVKETTDFTEVKEKKKRGILGFLKSFKLDNNKNYREEY